MLGISRISAILLLVGFGSFRLAVNARGINLGLCDDTKFQCRCGNGDPTANVRLPIKQCTFFHRWKPSCKPCNKITTYDVCPKYMKCLRCHESDEQNGKCTECPPGQYGDWCDGECLCQNGGTCDRQGNCHCLDKYNGRHCEIIKAVYCRHPSSPKNGFAEYTSTIAGSEIIYSCAQNFKLVGTRRNKCSKEGVWVSAVPVCVRACKVPVTLPANVEVEILNDNIGGSSQVGSGQPQLNKDIKASKIKFKCSNNYTLEGFNTLTCVGNDWNGPIPRCYVPCKGFPALENGQASPTSSQYFPDSVVTFACKVGYVLRGSISATCRIDGTWTNVLPKCENLVLCDDPGAPKGGYMQGSGPFSAGATVTFSCKQNSIMIGHNKIVCSANGEWSDTVPSCLVVSEKKIKCDTTGEEVASESVEPVRLQCPEGCVDKPGNIWGTVIYETKSSVCRAAVHSGKLKGRDGGAIVIINNEKYTGFVPSTINGITSQSYDTMSNSFRFSNTPPTIFGTGAITAECPKGWTEVGDICILAIEKEKIWDVANAVCKNIDAELTTIKPEKLSQLAPNLSKEGKSYWMKSMCNYLKSDGARGLSVANDQDCVTTRPFICQLRLLSKGTECNDPGIVLNSKRKEKNSINGKFYEGSEVTYKCGELYYIEGGETVRCLSSGKWNFPTPLCHRIPACEELKVPVNGFLEYNDPGKIPKPVISRRGGFPTSRSFPFPKFGGGQFPLSLSAKTTNSQAEKVPKADYTIPSGYHKVGVRASVVCRSKLYKRVGSRVRRCLSSGLWSGSQSSCIPVCGVSSTSRTSFVANGNVSRVGEWPWQVAISRWWATKNVFFLICGGSVLNERWIMTAAHCVTYQKTTEVVTPSAFQIYMGKHYRNDSSDDDQVQIRFISEIHVHPEYDPIAYDSDIALVKLSKPVELTTRVRPVCLPTFKSANNHLVEGRIGVVTGWGALETGEHPEELQQAKVPVVPSSQCIEDYRSEGLPLTITDYMFCAGYKEGKADACSGDSGGPIVFQDRSTHKWFQEGIVSWGSPNGCGNKNQYGGYTRVERFIEWIQEFL